MLKIIFVTLIFFCNMMITYIYMYLRLVGAIFVDSQWFKKIHLPSLKKLKLDNGYWEMSLINALLSGCPILESLDAYICAEDYDEIRVPPTLKRLNTTVDYGNQ